MAIVDKQTECLRIITIGYLKNFIGDLIKDSNGNVVHINEDAKPDFSNDSYCPTYSELTGGTLIPNHVEGESPENDIDGIVVNSIFYNDGISPYTENQQVNQKDLSVAYTTFNGFSIGAEPTTISECGGNSTLNFLYGFTRNLKYMTSSCTVTTSAYSITDLEGDDISWSTSAFGEITYPLFSVGKNGEISANSRTTIVTGRVTFQGVDYSDTVTITQNALTGDYTALEGRHYTGVTAYETTPKSFDCGGGDYAIRATGYYYDRYNWVDSCGYEYVNVYRDIEGTEDAGTNSGHFDEIICPSGDTEHPIHLSETLPIEYHGNTDSVVFTLDCVDRPDCVECVEHDSEIIYTAQTVDCRNGSVVVLGQHIHYTPNGRDASGYCIYTETIVDDSYTVTYECNPTSEIRDVDTTGRRNVIQAAGPCCCDGAMSVSSVTCFDHSAHTNVIIGNYELLSQDVTNIHINNGDYPSWLTNVVLDTSNMDITASMDAIPCETVGRNGSVIISFNTNGKSCSIPFNVCQEGNSELCPCTSYTYSVNCKVDTVELVCNADDDIDLNLTYIPCNETQVNLSLDVLRKCIAPHETNWSKYDDYTVQWSVPSAISVVDPFAKVLVATIPTNNGNTEKQWTITATCIVGNSVEYCQAMITQQAGPCSDYVFQLEAEFYFEPQEDMRILGNDYFSLSDVKAIEVDGILYDDVIPTTYRFDGYGTRTVKYAFNDPTTIAGGVLFNCENTTATILSGVTSIESWAFGKCTDMQRITIPSGVTSIGQGAFYDCVNLTSINIPSGVTSIGRNAFTNCSSLTSIVIPSGVTSIDFETFANCSNLTDCTFEQNSQLTIIGASAFRNCTNLLNIDIPDSVIAIDSWAFDNCTNLSTLTLGSGISNIGSWAFDNCSSLTTVEIDNNTIMSASTGLTDIFGSQVETYIIGDSVTSIGDYAFDGCSSLTSCTIGSGVTSIGQGVFYDCVNLTSIEIPSGVTSIGSDAFCGCSDLGEIYCYPVTPPDTDGNDIFVGVMEGGTLYVPTSSRTSYEQWYNFINELSTQNWTIEEI